jgi:hypothetical protein
MDMEIVVQFILMSRVHNLIQINIFIIGGEKRLGYYPNQALSKTSYNDYFIFFKIIIS